MGFGLPFRRQRINASTTFSVTPLGKQKAEAFGSDPKSRVLIALDEIGSGSVKEVAEEAHLGRGQCENILVALVRGGYVHSIKSAEE